MNLTTSYLGLTLKNPIVVSSCPLSRDVNNVRRMEDAGAAALVMHSLFEEQIGRTGDQLDHYLAYGHDDYSESLTYFPDIGNLCSVEDHFALIDKIVDAVDFPVVGSLNGTSPQLLAQYAAKMEQTGIKALELNLYELPTNPAINPLDLENRYVDTVQAVCEAVTIPVAVKLSPFFTALPSFCQRLVDAGAKGLVLFNRFYQPDIDIEKLTVEPRLQLSESNDLRLPLRWVAILKDRIRADFAITGGIHSSEDVAKGLLAGASVTMMASTLLQQGIERIPPILNGLVGWMTTQDFESISQFQGMLTQERCQDPVAFERANYLRVLGSYSKK